MQYLLCWSISPEKYDVANDAFLYGRVTMSEGLIRLGRKEGGLTTLQQNAAIPGIR
jgi:hypothetical protein